jgi:two-component sensor histidine kinase
MDRSARVQVVNVNNLVTVPISSSTKPEIDESFQEKWQELVDIAARIIGVPSGLIMRLLEDEIEVFKSSHTKDNPYEPREKAELGCGLYCETVVGRREALLVPNALADKNWKDNPDVQLKMISYFGVPILWPDGEVFGTLCVLDSKENSYTEDHKLLIEKFAGMIEHDLKEIQIRSQLQNTIGYKEVQIREMRHRIKNQLNMLISYIDLNRDQEKGSYNPDLMQDLHNHINALYRLHNILNQQESDYTIPVVDHLRRILKDIVSNSSFPIGIMVRGDDFHLPEESMVPLMMIINELATNSMKYAFSKVENPEIRLDCREKEGRIIFSYADNGSMTKPTAEITKGLGMMIIEGLSSQLGGSTQIDMDKGFHFTLEIPGQDGKTRTILRP